MSENKSETRIAEIAKNLSENSKADIIRNLDEAVLRKGIQNLLENMEPSSYVELYHGDEEEGKDLVMIRKSAFGEQPVAIVVVRGDIRTRSAGLVEKIISQVNQCFTYPASLKTKTGKVRISHVWVMLAGTHSKGANKRFDAEVARPNVNLYDLNWLVDKFTKYYPHIFFESRISEFIEDKIKELETHHILKEKVKLLTDYYVPQSLGNLEQIIEFSPENVFSLISEIRPVDDIRADLRSGTKILIAGEPGVGKSTALTKIAIDILSDSLSAATKKKGQILPIPVVLNSREFANANNAKEVLERFGLTEELRDRFAIQVLMIDGLDELPGNLRKPLIEKAIKFSSELSSALIISSRKIDLVKEESLPLTKKELLPLQYGQAVTLFSRVIKDKAKLDSLKEGLSRIQGQFSMTPLTLLLLIELAESEKEIPSSVVLLYNKFFDLALGLDDKKNKGLDMLFDPEIKRVFLERLAYELFFSRDVDSITISEFEGFRESFSREYGWGIAEIKDFAVEIERAGILDIRDSVRFAHATFLDFFVASRIYNIREDIPDLLGYLTNVYYSKWWFDVVFYYAGLKKSLPKEFIRMISEYRQEDEDISFTVAKVLIGRLLQAAWQSTTDTKIYGIETSQAYCDTLREQFLKYALNRNPNMPNIYADFFTLKVCESAYLSRHLWSQSETLINAYLANPTQASICKALHLLWVFRDKIEDKVRQDLIDKLYRATVAVPHSTVDDYSIYTRNLSFLKIIAADDPTTFKIIQKKMIREYQQNPMAFKRLLPAQRRGFRPKR